MPCCAKVSRPCLLREGQPAFRANLMEAYSYRCVVTECDAPQALEAAHIRPYGDLGTNDIYNGLLLRADIHTLFDRNMLAVDPQTREVRLAPPLSMTQYRTFSGRRLPDPKEEWQRPSQDLLNERWEEFQKAWKTTLALSCSWPLAVVAAVVHDMQASA